MAVSPGELLQAFNKGCMDQKENKYRPPANSLKVGTGFGTSDEMELNASYDRGWEASKRREC